MIKGTIFLLALLSSVGASAADTICRLELLERAGPHLTAVLTKKPGTASIKYDRRACFLYPVTYECTSPGIRVCRNEKPWSLDAISFEYPPYALTLSLLDRNAYAGVETVIAIRVWRMVNCIGDLNFD